MEKALLLKAEIREKVGKNATKALRKEGKMPATIYGHKQEPVAAALNFHDTVEGLHHGYRVLDIELNGKKQTVMFKDLQYDYLGKEVIHVDLMRVDAAELVKVMVPVELKGPAAGINEGGIIDEHADSLEIECKVSEMPETIEISVKDLNVGEHIYAGDVKLAAGLTLVSDPKLLIVSCVLPAAAVEVEEGEEGVAAPEVIGEKKEEEEE